jgi:hypothetical protein
VTIPSHGRLAAINKFAKPLISHKDLQKSKGTPAMKVQVVLADPEHQSFNGAMVERFTAGGDEIQISHLCATQFNPVSGWQNFITVKESGSFQAVD